MKAKTLINQSISPFIAVIVATLLIVAISAQGHADETTWVLHERTLPAPAAASKALKDFHYTSATTRCSSIHPEHYLQDE